MNTAPIVWVMQEGRNDYAPAEDFGEVRFVTKADFTKFLVSSQNEEVKNDVRRFLKSYIPGIDYIVAAGNPIVVALITISLPPGQHNFLKWDGRRALYVPHVVEKINH